MIMTESVFPVALRGDDPNLTFVSLIVDEELVSDDSSLRNPSRPIPTGKRGGLTTTLLFLVFRSSHCIEYNDCPQNVSVDSQDSNFAANHYPLSGIYYQKVGSEAKVLIIVRLYGRYP